SSLKLLTDLYVLPPQTITASISPGFSFSIAMRCSIYTTFGFIPSRSNTVSAVTKVPPLGRSTLMVLPSKSLRLRTDFDAMTCHCCPVKRGLFCKLGLLHKGFWGVYFGGTLSAVWASGGNFLPDFIFESGRYHVRRPNPLFIGHGFCSVDEFRSHCPEVWWRRARPNASLHGTFPRYGI